MNEYKRLIALANEVDTPSTSDKVIELNRLLSNIIPDQIQKEHYVILDDLINILFNTNNIFMENAATVDALQIYVRCKSG